MTAAAEKLRAPRELTLQVEALTLSAEHAPTGLPTCPNCTRRIKLPPNYDRGGGDFWECTASPSVPAFTFSRVGVSHPIDLKTFDPAAPHADRLNATACPLFESAAPFPSRQEREVTRD